MHVMPSHPYEREHTITQRKSRAFAPPRLPSGRGTKPEGVSWELTRLAAGALRRLQFK